LLIPENLTALELPLNGRVHRLKMRVPEVAEVIPLVMPPEIRSPSLVEASLALELQSVIDIIDGEVPDESQARAIVRSPESLARILHVRNGLYHFLAEQGRALAYCPVCPDTPVELDLLFYWLALRLPAWDFFDRGILMLTPSLSSELPSGKRPEQPPRSRRLGFRYPSDPPIEGTLASLQSPEAAAAVAKAWARWVPPGHQARGEERHWRRNSVGFCGILRLGVAISRTPKEVDQLPIGVFLFLDLLHFATNNVDASDPQRLKVQCPTCGAPFLPVL
jgi:hypothetical protein